MIKHIHRLLERRPSVIVSNFCRENLMSAATRDRDERYRCYSLDETGPEYADINIDTGICFDDHSPLLPVLYAIDGYNAT